MTDDRRQKTEDRRQIGCRDAIYRVRSKDKANVSKES